MSKKEPFPPAAKPRVKKAAPPVPAAPPPGVAPLRESLLSYEERLQRLGALPSLKETPSPLDAPAASLPRPLDPEAPPPAPLVPPPNAEPYLDRGAPIPSGYGLDRVVLIPRDPFRIMAYWELGGGVIERLRFKYSAENVEQSRWVLRMSMSNAREPMIVDVDPKVGQWYVKVAPGGRYRAEFGFILPDGTFEVLCRSNEIVTPREGVSDLVDERWAVAREDIEELLIAVGGETRWWAAGPGGSEKLMQLARQDEPRAGALFSGMARPEPPPEPEVEKQA